MKKVILLLLALCLTSCVWMDPRVSTQEGRALLRVAKRIAYKQVRKHLKGDLDDQFREDYTMRFEEYERRASEIHGLGSKGRRVDFEELMIREEIVGRNREILHTKNVEDPVDIFRWGPILVDDEGSIKFNPLMLFSKSEDLKIHAADRADEPLNSEPLFRVGDRYKINVRLRISTNIGRTWKEQDPTKLFDKYRLRIRTHHYTDVVNRKRFTREWDIAVDNKGEVAVLFNFIIPFY